MGHTWKKMVPRQIWCHLIENFSLYNILKILFNIFWGKKLYNLKKKIEKFNEQAVNYVQSAVNIMLRALGNCFNHTKLLCSHSDIW